MSRFASLGPGNIAPMTYLRMRKLKLAFWQREEKYRSGQLDLNCSYIPCKYPFALDFSQAKCACIWDFVGCPSV